MRKEFEQENPDVLEGYALTFPSSSNMFCSAKILPLESSVIL